MQAARRFWRLGRRIEGFAAPFCKGPLKGGAPVRSLLNVRCDASRRYVQLAMTSDLAERQVRRTTFSRCECGAAGRLAFDDPR